MVRHRVHFMLGTDEWDEDPTPPISEYVKLYSTVTSATAIETQSVAKNVSWCEENKVDGIWEEIVRVRELSCRNPKFNGWTADEIIDSLLIDEYQIRWEAAREADEAQERARIEEEEREEWEFPTADTPSTDLTSSLEEVVNHPRSAVVELGNLEHLEILANNRINTMTNERFSAGTSQRLEEEWGVWSDEGEEEEEVVTNPEFIEGCQRVGPTVGKQESENKEKVRRVWRYHGKGEG
ncbi:unnamed protein product [Tuber aestivum]|uniref:Uncharacterized protein n=1 Tax=Tuber aestivum TaxID=59557 RepID=A0A292PMN6_9PEZI|nr:unnamed protein product [Tuber aestivum]